MPEANETPVKNLKKAVQEAKKAEIIEKTTEMVENAKKNSQVLNAFRIEKRGNDAVLFERVILSDKYAGVAGVKEFENRNGKITYYTERQVKKYSDNVVRE